MPTFGRNTCATPRSRQSPLCGSGAAPFFASFPEANLIDATDRAALVSMLDKGHTDEPDFKLPLTCESLGQCLGAAKLNRLSAFFEQNLPGSSFTEIILRRTQPHKDYCIGFHKDHSLATLQVPLNDDFVGGNLVYLDQPNRRIVQPRRPPSSATLHNNAVVHGVTKLEQGVRYALFLLQTPASLSIEAI